MVIGAAGYGKLLMQVRTSWKLLQGTACGLSDLQRADVESREAPGHPERGFSER